MKSRVLSAKHAQLVLLYKIIEELIVSNKMKKYLEYKYHLEIFLQIKREKWIENRNLTFGAIIFN